MSNWVPLRYPSVIEVKENVSLITTGANWQPRKFIEPRHRLTKPKETVKDKKQHRATMYKKPSG